MVEEIPIFLMPIELPEFCFLSEAIEWSAVGRVPQFEWHSDSSFAEIVESRFYWKEMPDNFEPNFDYPWYEKTEFEDLGISIHEEYFAAARKCDGEFVNSLPEKIKEYEVDLSQFRSAPSAHLSGLSFKSQGTFPA